MVNGNINGLNNTNKYVQGSVWKWIRKEYAGNQAGVQSSERPVLIISNDTFNTHSQSVNCVSITSVLKESPVHVPLYISMDSHIQCEQLHTVSKTELTEYKGMVSSGVLSNVKAKIRLQLDMSEDRTTILFDNIKKSIDDLTAKSSARVPSTENIAILNAIKDSLHDLNRRANKGFGIPEIETDVIKILKNIHEDYGTIRSDINGIKSLLDGNTQVKPEQSAAVPDIKIKSAETIKPVTTGSKRGRGKQRKYTEEDKKFIADKNNPIGIIAEKYGFTKQYAHKMRHYFRTRLNDSEETIEVTEAVENIEETVEIIEPVENIEQEQNKQTKPTRYSEEDIKFITDKKNSIASIVEKYGFADKAAVYRTRGYLKKAYVKTKET